LVFLLLVLVGTFFPDNRYIRNNMIGIFITGIITILFWQKRIHIKRSSKRIIRFRRLARKNSRIKLCRIGYVIGIILLISGIGLYYYSSEIRNQLEDDIGEWEKSNRYYNWNIGEFEELRSAYIQELQDEVKMYQLIENVGIVFVVMGVVYIPLMIMIKRGKKKGSSNSSK